GVDGDAPRQQGVGGGGPAVVQERSQVQLGGGDADPVAGHEAGAAGADADDIVALAGEGPKDVGVGGSGVQGDDGVAEVVGPAGGEVTAGLADAGCARRAVHSGPGV